MIDYKKYEELSLTEQSVLCFAAFSGQSLNRQTITRFCEVMNETPGNVEESLLRLKQKGLLCRYETSWVQAGDLIINHQEQMRVLFFLVQRHRRWLNQFRDVGYMSIAHPISRKCLELVLDVTDGDATFFQNKLEQITEQVLEACTPIMLEQDMQRLVWSMRFDTFYRMMEYQLDYLLDHDLRDSGHTLLRMWDTQSRMQSGRRFRDETNKDPYACELWHRTLLYVCYASGVFIARYTKIKTTSGELLDAASCVQHGDFTAAISHYKEALALSAKENAKEGHAYFRDAISNYLYALALVKCDNAEGLEGLQKIAKEKISTNNKSILPAYILALHYGGKDRQEDDSTIRQFFEVGETGHKMTYTCLAYLLCRHLKRFYDVDLAARHYNPQLQILRQELCPYLPEAIDENHLTDTSIIAGIKQRAPWEKVLHDISLMHESARGKDTESKVSDVRETRLIYVVKQGEDQAHVREQMRLKNGEWGNGRPLSQARYESADAEMSDIDRMIWRKWKKAGRRLLSLDIILPCLQDTGTLYVEHKGQLLPASVKEESPFISTTKTADGIMIGSNVPREPLNDLFKTIVYQYEEPGSFTLYPMSDMQRIYFRQLLSIGLFPMEAEKQLQQFFPKLEDAIEIHGDISNETDQMETIDGSSILLLQARQKKGVFLLQLAVRPMPQGHRTFVPGRGAEIVYDELDGKRFIIRRDLKKERERLAIVQSKLEDMGVAYERELTEEVHVKPVDHSNPAEIMELIAEQMLQLIEFVQKNTSDFILEWPEGEKLRLVSLEPTDFNIEMTGHGSWFAIEGTVNVGDAQLENMHYLLCALGECHGKYVRISDKQFVTMSQTLREQIERIDALLNGQGKLSMMQAAMLSDDLSAFGVRTPEEIQELRKKILESNDVRAKIPTSLQATLRPYQQEGFQWMSRLGHWGAGGCLADDMGLGKTVQSITFLLSKADEGASLVLAPTSVVPNWRKELKRFAPDLDVIVLNEVNGRASVIQEAGPNTVIVGTYGMLNSEVEAMTEKRWNTIFLDEGHTIKNRNARTTITAMQLKSNYRFILTGTPIQNHLGELWTLFRFLIPTLLGSYDEFFHKFRGPIETNHDIAKQIQLQRIIKPFLLRRTKEEVIKELPVKKEMIIPVHLSDEEMSIYELIRRRAETRIQKADPISDPTGKDKKIRIDTLAEITRLRMAACCAGLVQKNWQGTCAKIDKFVSLTRQLRQTGENHILVFSQFTSFLEKVKVALDLAGIDYLYLDGETPLKTREHLVERFQSGECCIFLISLKAGGLGLNLTKANCVIHLDPWWNPAIEQQATDRAYRIGQEREVNVYHLISENTLEEKILNMHNDKRGLAKVFMNSRNAIQSIGLEELVRLFTSR